MGAGHHHHHHGHEPGHSHVHDHGHAHAPANFDRAFAIGIALNLAFVAIEAGYGLAAGSLALLADAGHNLSDVLGLVLAWAAAWAGRQRPTTRYTYGFRRASILASLANAVLLLVAVGVIVAEAVERFGAPRPVETGTVMLVAGIGIVINAATAWFFFSGRKTDLNIRGAYLHMAADAAVSAGVVVSAYAMQATGLLWIDPAVSLLVAVVITVGTWGLLSGSVALALDAVPAHIDRGEVERFLAALPGVTAITDLHIWAMSTTEVALTAHLVRPGAAVDDAFILDARAALGQRFGIGHVTLQIESGAGHHGLPPGCGAETACA
jgi:cobalt-zinc-cadmium efflux system protein